MSKLKTRVLTKNDWETYRVLRLLSLQDSPDSFGSTYEREVEFTNEEWSSRLDSNSRAKCSLPIVAELDGIPVGLAWGVQPISEDGVAHVYQMWVSPTARGQGVGKLLLNQIIAWAKESDLITVFLAVTTTNIPAVNLYKSVGFQPYGEQEALREGSPLSVQPMKLDLRCEDV